MGSPAVFIIPTFKKQHTLNIQGPQARVDLQHISKNCSSFVGHLVWVKKHAMCDQVPKHRNCRFSWNGHKTDHYRNKQTASVRWTWKPRGVNWGVLVIVTVEFDSAGQFNLIWDHEYKITAQSPRNIIRKNCAVFSLGELPWNRSDLKHEKGGSDGGVQVHWWKPQCRPWVPRCLSSRVGAKKQWF